MIDLFWSLSKNSSKIIVISNFLSIRNIFAYMQTEKIFLWQVICVCVWICVIIWIYIFWIQFTLHYFNEHICLWRCVRDLPDFLFVLQCCVSWCPSSLPFVYHSTQQPRLKFLHKLAHICTHTLTRVTRRSSGIK